MTSDEQVTASLILLSEDEKRSGFPCYCGAENYADAEEKCCGDPAYVGCCAEYMLEHFLLTREDDNDRQD